MIPRLLRNVRIRLILALAAATALVVALAGLVLTQRVDHRDRAALDRALTARADQVQQVATRSGALPTDRVYTIRLIQAGTVRAQVGSKAGFPLPVEAGYSTVTAGGSEWRSFARVLATGVQMQVLISLDDGGAGHTADFWPVALLALIAGLLGGGAGWLLAGLALRPLDDMRASLAALGADLETLISDPDLPVIQRHLLLAAMENEERRMIELLDAARD